MSIERFAITQKKQIDAFFEENGFVIIKGGLSDEQLSDFRTELKNLINAFLLKAGLPERADDSVFTGGLRALEAVDSELVGSIYDAIFQSPAFFRIIGDKKIEALTRLLLGITGKHPLYGFTNRCLIAPPTDERRTYGWHQEIFYTIPRGSYLQTWGPLIFETTAATGTIEVLPGSHKEGIAKQIWYDVPGRSTQILIHEDIVEKYRPIQVEMKLGELMIFSGFLAHKSGRNTSDKVRYSLVGMYHDVRHPPFRTPKVTFNYRGETPREFYNKVICDE